MNVISLLSFQGGICSGELAQMVERSLNMREVPADTRILQ